MPDLISASTFPTSSSRVLWSDECLKGHEEMTVQTKTSASVHNIHWAIDDRSLYIANLAAKGDKRGVIEANVEKGGHTFKLELCASGWRNSQDSYSAFYLTVPDQDETFVARYRVQVGDIQRISSIRHDFHLGVGFPNFCLQTALSDGMMGGHVRFFVSVEVFSCSSVVKCPKLTEPLPVALCADSVLSRWMRRLFKERVHADVSLICRGGKRIAAHKSVLSVASPVFSSMFRHEMVESRTNEVNMLDWDCSSVEEMVRFIYTARLPYSAIDVSDDDEEVSSSSSEAIFGSQDLRDGKSGLDDDEQMSDSETTVSSEGTMLSAVVKGDCSSDLSKHSAFHLFELAEFYKIQPLVVSCCECLHQGLTADSACDLLIRIQKYSHVREICAIHDAIWDFITSNLDLVKRSDGYSRLLRHYPVLLSQLIDKITH
jgi:hypothetical protein